MPFVFLIRAGAGALMADPEIPTVTLCELASHSGAYFEKTVRLSALLEQWTEGQYLTDERCPLSHDDQIGVGYAPQDDKQRESAQRISSEIQSHEYAGKAEVTIVGRLRNISARHFYWYGTRFDIAYFESARPAVARFEGYLEEGRTYRAQGVQHEGGELTVDSRLRVPFHHAGRIEWTNLGDLDRVSVIYCLRLGGSKPSPLGDGFSARAAG